MRFFIRISTPSLFPSILQHRGFSRHISALDLVGPVDSCGDRLHLSRAITLIESSRPSHRAAARALLQEALALAPQSRLSSSFRVGISGPPGAAACAKCYKNSLAEQCTPRCVHVTNLAFRRGQEFVHRALGYASCGQRQHGTKLVPKFPTQAPRNAHFILQVAVLAIDPSSAVSGGSILGDKTRMAELSHSPHAYALPLPHSNIVTFRQIRATISYRRYVRGTHAYTVSVSLNQLCVD
jgi:LAO/AO transport system kinase